MTELYCVWTIINILLILAGLWLNRRAEKMLDEAEAILDKDEKMLEETNNALEEWEHKFKEGEKIDELRKNQSNER